MRNSFLRFLPAMLCLVSSLPAAAQTTSKGYAAISVTITGYIAPKDPVCEETPKADLPPMVIAERICDQPNAMSMWAGNDLAYEPGGKMYLEFSHAGEGPNSSLIALPVVTRERLLGDGWWSTRVEVDVPKNLNADDLTLRPDQALTIFYE